MAPIGRGSSVVSSLTAEGCSSMMTELVGGRLRNGGFNPAEFSLSTNTCLWVRVLKGRKEEGRDILPIVWRANDNDKRCFMVCPDGYLYELDAVVIERVGVEVNGLSLWGRDNKDPSRMVHLIRPDWGEEDIIRARREVKLSSGEARFPIGSGGSREAVISVLTLFYPEGEGWRVNSEHAKILERVYQEEVRRLSREEGGVHREGEKDRKGGFLGRGNGERRV